MNEQSQQMQAYQPKKLTFSQYINSKTGMALVNNAIKDPSRRDAFVTAIVSAVSTNPGLQECTAPSIISAALQGVSLGLAPSPQLGQFYMVPFKNQLKGTDGKKLWALDASGQKMRDERGRWIPVTESVAQFIPGYRGYVQLALRSGEYLDLDARPVKEGEYKGLDGVTGRPRFQWIEDDEVRESLPTVGYMAYFELLNGFRKILYWSKEKMLRHADRYSQAFSKDATTGKYPSQSKVSFADYEAGNYPQEDEWKYSSFWYKDFDTMAGKTMLKQLLTKWGPLSIQMQKAIELDDRNTRTMETVDESTIADAALPPAPVASAPLDGSEYAPEADAQGEDPEAQEAPPREEMGQAEPQTTPPPPPQEQTQDGTDQMGFGDLV